VDEGALGLPAPALLRATRAQRAARILDDRVALEDRTRHRHERGRQVERLDRPLGQRALVRADRGVVEADLDAVVAAAGAEGDVDARLGHPVEYAAGRAPRASRALRRSAQDPA